MMLSTDQAGKEEPPLRDPIPQDLLDPLRAATREPVPTGDQEGHTWPPRPLPISRGERRRRRRATATSRCAHATRERVRVEAFNAAFSDLRRLLPVLPPNKKLSKMEVLRLAMCYISYLDHVLDA